MSDAFAVVPSGCGSSTSFVSPGARAGERALELLHERACAELHDEVALAFSGVGDHVDHDDVAATRGPVLDRRQLRDRRAQRLDLLVHDLLRHLGLRVGHLELRPVRRLGLRLHGDRRDEAEIVFLGAGQVVVVFRRRHRPDARGRSRVHEPAADVALDGLAEDALPADARLEHPQRDFPLAEARHLHAARQVGGGVLDRVAEIRLRHVHPQSDPVVRKLLDLRRHRPVH